MSRCQDFGKGSIVEVKKGGSFGEFECRCMRITAHGGVKAARNRLSTARH